MKQNLVKSISVLWMIFVITTVSAQEAVIATGGNASGTDGSVSYSVGQVTYTTIESSDGTVTQGVQQAYEIFSISQTCDYKNKISVFPNPATDLITLEFEDVDLTEINYQIYDSNGKLLLDKKCVTNKTSFSLKEFVPAVYYLKATKGNSEIAVFKIIKN
jgi:hypothetical protein